MTTHPSQEPEIPEDFRKWLIEQSIKIPIAPGYLFNSTEGWKDGWVRGFEKAAIAAYRHLTAQTPAGDQSYPRWVEEGKTAEEGRGYCEKCGQGWHDHGTLCRNDFINGTASLRSELSAAKEKIKALEEERGREAVAFAAWICAKMAKGKGTNTYSYEYQLFKQQNP